MDFRGKCDVRRSDAAKASREVLAEGSHITGQLVCDQAETRQRLLLKKVIRFQLHSKLFKIIPTLQ